MTVIDILTINHHDPFFHISYDDGDEEERCFPLPCGPEQPIVVPCLNGTAMNHHELENVMKNDKETNDDNESKNDPARAAGGAGVETTRTTIGPIKITYPWGTIEQSPPTLPMDIQRRYPFRYFNYILFYGLFGVFLTFLYDIVTNYIDTKNNPPIRFISEQDTDQVFPYVQLTFMFLVSHLCPCCCCMSHCHLPSQSRMFSIVRLLFSLIFVWLVVGPF